VELPVEVRLPERALYQHLLVVGTTGAGKTVLLKNMALSTLHEIRNATVVALDLQGDYLLMTLPPETPGLHQPLDEITVIMPTTRHFIDRHRDDIQHIAAEILGEGHTLLDVEEEEATKAVGYALAKLFIDDTYPGAKLVKAEVKVEDTEVKEIDAKVEAWGRVFTVRLLPWAMKFAETYAEVPRLFPYFSERVSLLFRRLIHMAGQEHDIDAITARRRRRKRHIKDKTTPKPGGQLRPRHAHGVRNRPIRRVLQHSRADWTEDPGHLRRARLHGPKRPRSRRPPQTPTGPPPWSTGCYP
jgi:Domain of unknown function DUF87.